MIEYSCRCSERILHCKSHGISCVSLRFVGKWTMEIISLKLMCYTWNSFWVGVELPQWCHSEVRLHGANYWGLLWILIQVSQIENQDILGIYTNNVTSLKLRMKSFVAYPDWIKNEESECWCSLDALYLFDEFPLLAQFLALMLRRSWASSVTVGQSRVGCSCVPLWLLHAAMHVMLAHGGAASVCN